MYQSSLPCFSFTALAACLTAGSFVLAPAPANAEVINIDFNARGNGTPSPHVRRNRRGARTAAPCGTAWMAARQSATSLSWTLTGTRARSNSRGRFADSFDAPNGVQAVTDATDLLRDYFTVRNNTATSFFSDVTPGVRVRPVPSTAAATSPRSVHCVHGQRVGTAHVRSARLGDHHPHAAGRLRPLRERGGRWPGADPLHADQRSGLTVLRALRGATGGSARARLPRAARSRRSRPAGAAPARRDARRFWSGGSRGPSDRFPLRPPAGAVGATRLSAVSSFPEGKSCLQPHPREREPSRSSNCWW